MQNNEITIQQYIINKINAEVEFNFNIEVDSELIEGWPTRLFKGVNPSLNYKTIYKDIYTNVYNKDVTIVGVKHLGESSIYEVLVYTK